MSLYLIIGLLLITVIGTISIAKAYPSATKNYFYEPIDKGRTILGALALSLLAWTFLRSGIYWRMGIALIAIAWVVSLIVYEEPFRDIK